MGDSKKYYYLKLKEDFFESDEMVILESMPDGYLYSNILLKLYLRSLKQNGKLMFNDKIPFNSAMLASITRHSVGNIEKAVKIFKELDMIEVLDNGAIYMLDIQNFVGESSTQADRMRDYRRRIAHEKKKLESVDVTNVATNDVTGVITKVPQSIEIRDKSIEIRDKDILSGKPDSVSPEIEKIIAYLNEKAKTKYRATTPKTRNLIKARLAEGFAVEDFEKVIDTKVAEWGRDPNMSKYLRPETLFGTKFEGYLNQKPSRKQERIPDWLGNEAKSAGPPIKKLDEAKKQELREKLVRTSKNLRKGEMGDEIY